MSIKNKKIKEISLKYIDDNGKKISYLVWEILKLAEKKKDIPYDKIDSLMSHFVVAQEYSDDIFNQKVSDLTEKTFQKFKKLDFKGYRAPELIEDIPGLSFESSNNESSKAKRTPYEFRNMLSEIIISVLSSLESEKMYKDDCISYIYHHLSRLGIQRLSEKNNKVLNEYYKGAISSYLAILLGLLAKPVNSSIEELYQFSRNAIKKSN